MEADDDDDKDEEDSPRETELSKPIMRHVVMKTEGFVKEETEM